MHLRPQFEPLARLAAAGCGLFGSRDLRWVHLFSRTQLFGSLISRGCVCPAGCCCGGYAAGARLGWLCPYNLGEHCTAPADMLQLHGTLPASFPLINNRPLSERAAGVSRLGEWWCANLSLRLHCHRAGYRRPVAWKGIYARSSRTWRCKKVYLC